MNLFPRKQMCLFDTYAPKMAITLKNVTLIFDLDIIDDLDLGSQGELTPNRIQMLNLKALSHRFQKVWQMLKFSIDKQTEKQTDTARTICPLSVDTGM